MSNHYHLLLKTPSGNLVSGMKWFQEKYTGLKVKELEECADTSEWTEQWKMLRRGWRCGGEGFRDLLMECADAAVAGKKRASLEAAGMRGHDEKEACRLLCRALKMLELGMEDLW